MKPNFLAKLFLLTIACLSLNSCTLDELISTPKSQTHTSSIAKDGKSFISATPGR